MIKGYEAIVVGVSAGGLEAITCILPHLPADFTLPLMVVQHIPANTSELMVQSLKGTCALPIKEAMDKEAINPGTVYIAPAGYHLLVEEQRTLSLSVDPPVNWARPSIDVLFQSAAEVYEQSLVGIVLTGANKDGSEGLKAIKEHGGLAVVQDPQTAQVDVMPRAAMDAASPDHVLGLEEIGPFLRREFL